MAYNPRYAFHINNAKNTSEQNTPLKIIKNPKFFVIDKVSNDYITNHNFFSYQMCP